MRLGAAVLLALAAAAATAGDIYTWKDKDGRVTYSDNPPPGNIPARTLGGRNAEAAPGPPENVQGDKARAPTAADQELEFRKRRAEASEQQVKADKAAAEAEDKRKNCERARNQLTALESGQRVARYNDKGEREFLDDAQRAQEIESARKAVDSWCK